MKVSVRLFLAVVLVLLACAPAATAQNTTNNSHNPTWWNKYQYLLNNPADADAGRTSSALVGTNVDMSNECGPQSETFVAINPKSSRVVAGGSNEIVRDPMRGYFSTNGGSSWGGVDMPLPAPIGTNGIRFGSDPGLAFDTLGNVFYSYIVVFFSNGNGINGTQMAVARSGDGGQTYPQVSFFDFSGGSDHFNDKPMVTTDQNAASTFKDTVYVAWDASSGGSTSAGGVRVAASYDHGASFTSVRADDPGGPGRAIGASPFVAPDGTLYVAWNDFAANTIAFNKSTDGGRTWAKQGVVAAKQALFDVGVPAESFRRALVYPACDADRSKGPFRGRLYCSWMDTKADGTTDILVAFSGDGGRSWSQPRAVTDQLPFKVDRFNQWLAVDSVTGDVNVSFYDTRNDTTGQRFMTDIYFSQSTDGGFSWRTPNTRVTDVSSNEHDCNGVFPCNAIDYGNQQGDYSGLASLGGVSHPIWTDSRKNTTAATGCRRGLTMEEVFTATVK